jgi:hypothetical protein
MVGLDMGDGNLIRHWSKPPKGTLHAIACDGDCQEPQRITYRQVAGLTSSRVFFLELYGKETDCRKLMKKIGVNEYVFCDGGSAVGDDKYVPTRIAVRW